MNESHMDAVPALGLSDTPCFPSRLDSIPVLMLEFELAALTAKAPNAKAYIYRTARLTL